MHQIIILMHPPQSNELLVLFVKKKKKRRIDFGHHDSKPHAYVKLQNVSQVHIHESSSQNLDFHFLPIYDQIMRVRKKIDQELHLKINVLKIKLKDTFGVISSIKKKNKENHSENAKGWNSITVHAKTDFICTSLFKSL